MFPEVPGIFKTTPLFDFIDVAIFSCIEGISKPNSRIYQIATERLDVYPEDCLYIGDGDSYELSGAAKARMHPVLFRNPLENSDDVYRVNSESENWNGQIIKSLPEILTLIT